MRSGDKKLHNSGKTCFSLEIKLYSRKHSRNIKIFSCENQNISSDLLKLAHILPFQSHIYVEHMFKKACYTNKQYSKVLFLELVGVANTIGTSDLEKSVFNAF